MPGRLGFRREMRLTSAADFRRAYRDGSRARGGILLVVLRENEAGCTRLGLSVGRKVWRSAVRRNRVRRVFREAFRTAYPELPEGVDIVLVPAAPALSPSLDETREELVRLARKAHGRFLEKQAGDS